MERRRRFSAYVASGHDPHPTILQALDFARAILPESCLDERGRVKTLVVVEEIVSNLLRHAGGGTDIAISLRLVNESDGIAIEVEDDGTPFDPVNDQPFDGIDTATGGGVGLALVRAWGQDIAYRREPHANRLSLTIR